MRAIFVCAIAATWFGCCVFAVAADPLPVRFGGFGVPPPAAPVECVSEEQRYAIESRIAANIARLDGDRARPAPQMQLVRLSWPVGPAPGFLDYGVHGVANFVDHNPMFPGMVQDYNCGTRTYDHAGGYNHAGTDIFNWPFGWYRMDHDQVRAVAAAPGEIVLKDDGHFDRNCNGDGGAWNAVYIRHADRSTAWYGHLKSGSLTPKPVGSLVAEGEYLGVVGSSGNSTGPHLHFELHDELATLVDPYGGPCNAWNPSWWTKQRPYYDSAINALLTHSAPPVTTLPCPTAEQPNTRDMFAMGETFYLAAYYRDLLAGQLTQFTLRDAAGKIVAEWSHDSNSAYYSAVYWYWQADLPQSGIPMGEWTFTAVYQGTTYEHHFWVGDLTAADVAHLGGLELVLIGAQPRPDGEIELEFRLPEAGHARLVLYDARGRVLARLVDAWQAAGAHPVRWHASQGSMQLAIARLTLGDRSVTRKILIAR